jgi:serine/threonine protein kinase
MNARQLGRYQLLGVLGKGAMGIVYEARDPHLDRLVAIKTIRLVNATEEQAASYERRFLTEARSAARLRHPAIVNVYDAGHDDDVTYLVMEKVNGVNLKHCLNEGVRFSMAGVARTLLDVLGALEHAHQHRIVHRDVKPENILIDATGLVKLTDFGIAKIQEMGADNGTQLSGGVIGTPRYMSPEQISGMPVDNRSDLFSAGVLLYELLTGHMPFDGPHAMAVANSIIHREQEAPSRLNPAVWPGLDAVVAQALQKSPEDRFVSAAAFAAALRSAIDTAPGGHTPLTSKLSSAVELATPDTSAVLAGLFVRGRQPAPPAQAPLAPDDETDGTTRVTTRPSVFGPATVPEKPRADAHAPPSSKPAAEPKWTAGVWLGAAAVLMAGGVLAWLWREPTDEMPVAAQPVPSAPPGTPTPRPAPASVTTPTPAAAPASAPSVAPAPPKTTPPPVVPAPPPKQTAVAPVSTPPARPPAAPDPVVIKPEKTAEGAKCSKLLEKASSGEPLSEQEQRDLVTSCR